VIMPASRDPDDRGRQARLSLVSFPTFYRLYYPLLVRILTAQAHDTSWAEDVAQDTMLAAYGKWEDLLVCDRPDSWLFKVAIRRLRRIEAKMRRECPYPDDAGSVLEDVRLAAAEDEWVDNEFDVVIGIRCLPRRQAEVIALHYLAGDTLDEVADILGISTSSAKTHKYRALASLKRQGAGDSCKSYNQPDMGEAG
jgi:RNA polymerase sigma factor (sigma-70 family)